MSAVTKDDLDRWEALPVELPALISRPALTRTMP